MQVFTFSWLILKNQSYFYYLKQKDIHSRSLKNFKPYQDFISIWQTFLHTCRQFSAPVRNVYFIINYWYIQTNTRHSFSLKPHKYGYLLTKTKSSTFLVLLLPPHLSLPGMFIPPVSNVLLLVPTLTIMIFWWILYSYVQHVNLLSAKTELV